MMFDGRQYFRSQAGDVPCKTRQTGIWMRKAKHCAHVYELLATLLERQLICSSTYAGHAGLTMPMKAHT